MSSPSSSAPSETDYGSEPMADASSSLQTFHSLPQCFESSNADVWTQHLAYQQEALNVGKAQSTITGSAPTIPDLNAVCHPKWSLLHSATLWRTEDNVYFRYPLDVLARYSAEFGRRYPPMDIDGTPTSEEPVQCSIIPNFLNISAMSFGLILDVIETIENGHDVVLRGGFELVTRAIRDAYALGMPQVIDQLLAMSDDPDDSGNIYKLYVLARLGGKRDISKAAFCQIVEEPSYSFDELERWEQIAQRLNPDVSFTY